VKRLNNVFANPVDYFFGSFITYSKRNNSKILHSDYVDINNRILNLSSVSSWNSNMIVVTTDQTLSSNGYIFIPSATTPSFEPLFYSGEGNEYRVYYNDMQRTREIGGIAYSYIYETSIGGLQNRLVYINFLSSCTYVDLFWAYVGSPTNPNGRIFWKTCKGEGGVLEATNQFTITGNTAPTF
jgi:hypothetical protein